MDFTRSVSLMPPTPGAPQTQQNSGGGGGLQRASQDLTKGSCKLKKKVRDKNITF